MLKPQFVCLSGLPRTGSTLLSALLSQNPLIHAEGNSAVCQFMWDMHQSGYMHAGEQLKANNREQTIGDLIAMIPSVYYKNIAPTKQIIVDKCRSWTIQPNVILLERYINPQPKIIVLERSVTEIIKSFGKLYRKNNMSEEAVYTLLRKMLLPNSEPIMRSIAGINWAKKNNQAHTFLFVHYNDLLAKPTETLARIYAFGGWSMFTHNFQKIINQHPENDAVYKLHGFHDVRPVMAKEENTLVLPSDILEKCRQIDKLMGYTDSC